MKNNFHLSIENAGQLEFLRNTRVTGFSSLEISGDLLEQNKESFPKNFRICAIRDLISPVLARLITFENISMQIKFGQLLRRQIALASELGATSGTIDFDLPEIIGTPEKEKQLHLLLKGLFGIAAGYKFKLLIQLRIPGSTDFDMQQLLRFKQGLLYPDFGYIFDFHPHEPGAFDFEEKVAKLPFDTGFWRLSFEPDKGNMLTRLLMEKFSAMTDHSMLPHGEVFICPGKAELDDALLAKISAIINPADHIENA